MATIGIAGEHDDGIEHVVHLNVIGLSGILLDSAKTKATVSKDKDMLIPPRQMKASLVVLRDDKLHGISSLSKRLTRTAATVVPSTIVSDGPPTQQKQHHRRYIAVWDNTTPGKNLTESHVDSTILFETRLSERTTNSGVPHRNYELFVGLTTTSPDSETTTIPIGVASLPIAEAAALRGSSGKVVLDLPIFNVPSLQVTNTNPFSKSSTDGVSTDCTANKRKKGLLSSFRKRQPKAAKQISASVVDSENSKKPCIYALDTSSEDPAILRVELELHEKESNVEIGLSSLTSSDPPFALLSDFTMKDNSDDDEESNRSKVVVLHDDADDINNPAIETSAHSSPSESIFPVLDSYMEEQSIERVLSIRNIDPIPTEKPKYQFSPARRFRVKCIDQTTSKFELTPVGKPEVASTDNENETILIHDVTMQRTYTLEQEREIVTTDYDIDAKTRLLDVAIERVLSERKTDDDDNDDELNIPESLTVGDDASSQRNEIPFDEQSFLSRDTAAVHTEKKKIIFPVKVEVTPEGPIDKSIFRLFRRRGNNNTKKFVMTNSPSLAGTEFSNHSMSHSESMSGSPSRSIGGISLSSEIFGEMPPKTPVPNLKDSILPTDPCLQQQTPVKTPVSILRTPSMSKRKVKEIVGSASLSMSENVQDLDIFDVPALNTSTSNDNMSIVSSSAETTVMKKVPAINYGKKIHKVIEKIASDDGLEEAPDTDTTASTQTSSTNTTPPSPKSTYSSSLPSFVEETTKPIILKEKYVFDADDDIVETLMTHKKPWNVNVLSNDAAESLNKHEKSVVPRNLTQNLYGLIDLQPCTGKLEGFLAVDDDEDYTIAESWTHNENSTLGTSKTRKESIHDDLADLGLLLDDMCRQSGFRAINDDYSLADEGTTKETIAASMLDKNGGKNRWRAAFGSTVRMPFGDSYQRSKRTTNTPAPAGHEDDEGDDNDVEEHSFASNVSSTSCESFADEQTFKSSTEESESELSEQGTEVDVKDLKIVPCDLQAISEVAEMHSVRLSPSVVQVTAMNRSVKDRQSVPTRSLRENEKCKLDGDLESSTDINTSSGLSVRQSLRWSKPGAITGPSMISLSNNNKSQMREPVPANKMALLPPKVPKPRTSQFQKLTAVERAAKRSPAVVGDESNGSNTDSQSPYSAVQPTVDISESNLKSIAQSLVDFVESVISPSTTSNNAATPTVPTVLDADDAASVGELTATTYERQVDVDEMRNAAEHLKSPLSDTTIVTSDNYFAEYEGGIISPEIEAAMEAAAAKQIAECWAGHRAVSQSNGTSF
jgi:hypothetical protein